jgi:hypothetical protein
MGQTIGVLMTKFVPRGYLSIAEALNRVGGQLFPEEWTGNEYKSPGTFICRMFFKRC